MKALVPARQPARLQPEVLPARGSGDSSSTSGGATCRESASPRSRSRRTFRSSDRSRLRAGRRCSAVGISGGYALQHSTASRAPDARAAAGRCARSPRSSGAGAGRSASSAASPAGRSTSTRSGSRRSRSCRRHRRAASACSRSAAGRLRRAERIGVGAALGGLVLLGVSLGSHAPTSRGDVVPVAVWIAASLVVAGGARPAGCRPRRPRHGRRRALRRRRRGHEGRRRRRGAAPVRAGAARLPRARVRLHAAGVPARRPARVRRARRALDERRADRGRDGALRARRFRAGPGRRCGSPPSRSCSSGRSRSAGAVDRPGVTACADSSTID